MVLSERERYIAIGTGSLLALILVYFLIIAPLFRAGARKSLPIWLRRRAKSTNSTCFSPNKTGCTRCGS